MSDKHNPAEIARLVRAVTERESLLQSTGFRSSCDCPSCYEIRARIRQWDLDNLRAMADQLEAAGREIARLAESVETMKDEVWEVAEDSFKCGRIAADLGCLVANSPSDAVQRLANRYEEATAERDRLRADLAAAAARIARLESEHDTLCLVVERTTGTIDKLTATRAELEAARREVERLRTESNTWDLGSKRMISLRSTIPACACRVCQSVDAYRAARDKAGGATVLSVTWRRGEADGRNGHPPAEITAEYLKGYAQGLESRR